MRRNMSMRSGATDVALAGGWALELGLKTGRISLSPTFNATAGGPKEASECSVEEWYSLVAIEEHRGCFKERVDQHARYVSPSLRSWHRVTTASGQDFSGSPRTR